MIAISSWFHYFPFYSYSSQSSTYLCLSGSSHLWPRIFWSTYACPRLFPILTLYTHSYQINLSKTQCSASYFFLFASKQNQNSIWHSRPSKIWSNSFGPYKTCITHLTPFQTFEETCNIYFFSFSCLIFSGLNISKVLMRCEFWFPTILLFFFFKPT